MKSNILADTSIWIEFFKKRTQTGDRLERLLTTNFVWTCGIVMFELLQGVRTEVEKTTILNAISGLSYVEMTQTLWEKSAVLSASLKQKGITLPLSDVFIAAISIEHNISIFTLDKHFEQIPNVKIYKI